jgi:hypothetical protein
MNNKIYCKTFTFKNVPYLQPLPIKTKGLMAEGRIIKALIVWLTSTRKWELTRDFHYTLNGEAGVTPKGFVFDGVSIPKILRVFFSPVGIFLIGGLIHDFIFRFGTLLKKDKQSVFGEISLREADALFLQINKQVNGMNILSSLIYIGLKTGSWRVWRKHRKANLNWQDIFLKHK